MKTFSLWEIQTFILYLKQVALTKHTEGANKLL